MNDESLRIPPEEELRVAPEDIAGLEERYPPEDERRPPPRERTRQRPHAYENTIEPESNLISLLTKGDIGIGEAWLLSDLMERRDRRAAREDQPPNLADSIAKALETAGITGKPSPEEMPEWAKSMRDDMTGISKKLEDDERRTEQEELIEKVTKPLQDQLEREREDRKRLEEKIDSIVNPLGPGDTKTGIDQYIDYQAKLRTAGLIKEGDTKGKIVFGKDGIPISGEIPAWAVYGPTLADEVFNNLEKRIETIATGFGVKQSKDLRDLIDLPERPETEKPKPPLRHVETEDAPPEVEEEPTLEIDLSEKPEVPIEELIKLPERVIPEDETAAPEGEPLEETPIEETEPQGLVASEIKYELEPEETPSELEEPKDESEETPEEAAQPVGEETDTVEKAEEEPKPEPEPLEPDKKQWICRFCGAGPFDETWQLAQHVKTCEKAKEAKEAEE